MEAPGLSHESIRNSESLGLDIPCRRCAYNLRGLSPSGRCPECGTPVGLSTQGDLLRFADPQWVETLARGARLMMWGTIVWLAVGICGAVIVRGTASRLSPVVEFVAILVSVIGAWLVTAPDPSGIGEDRTVSARKLIRVALVIGLASQLLKTVQIAWSSSYLISAVLQVAFAATALFGLVGEFAKFTYLRRLALRVPDPKQAGRANFLRWAFVITLGLAFSIGVIVFFLAGGMTTMMAAATQPASAPSGSNSPVISYQSVDVHDASDNPDASSTASTAAPRTTAAAQPSSRTRSRLITSATGWAGGGVFAVACGGGLILLAVVVCGVMTFMLYLRLARIFDAQAQIARNTWMTSTAARIPKPPVVSP